MGFGGGFVVSRSSIHFDARYRTSGSSSLGKISRVGVQPGLSHLRGYRPSIALLGRPGFVTSRRIRALTKSITIVSLPITPYVVPCRR